MEDEIHPRTAPTQLDLLNVSLEPERPKRSQPAEPSNQSQTSVPTKALAPPTVAIEAVVRSKVETLLIIDTETTGLDPEHDHCVEVGAILFDVRSQSVLHQLSFLLPVQSNAAEPINHIPASVSRCRQPWRQSLDLFVELVAAADVLVAHNAAFDRQWFGCGELPEIAKPWLCTMEDIRWPRDRQLKPRPSVRDLALAYGIPVWAAHRALTDCIYLAEVLARCDDLDTLLDRGLEPRQWMRANVSYADRSLAKEAGFRWNDPVKGSWTRRLSAREAEELPFDTSVVDAEALNLPMG